MRTIGALLKCLDRRRVGVELEESSMPVPILQFLTYTLYVPLKPPFALSLLALSPFRSDEFIISD